MKKLNMNGWRRIFREMIQEVKPNHVWSLKMDQRLECGHLEPGWTQVLQEHAHARFTCSQCQYSWSSHRVAILFHLHWEQQERRGAVWMRPFKQKCSECPSEKYEEAQFTDADVASVIHHLIFDIREKCYREHVDRGELPEVFWDVATAGLRHPQCEAFRIDLSPLRGGQAEVAVHPGRPQGAVQPGDPQPPLHCWIVNNQSAALPLTQRLNPTAQCVRIVAACAVLTVVILVVIGLVWFFRRIL